MLCDVIHHITVLFLDAYILCFMTFDGPCHWNFVIMYVMWCYVKMMLPFLTCTLCPVMLCSCLSIGCWQGEGWQSAMLCKTWTVLHTALALPSFLSNNRKIYILNYWEKLYIFPKTTQFFFLLTNSLEVNNLTLEHIFIYISMYTDYRKLLNGLNFCCMLINVTAVRMKSV